MQLGRRELLAGAAVLGAMLTGAPDALAAQAAQVGTYLPSANLEDYVLFVPDSKKTPAIRAGTVDPNNPYRFALPPTWREGKVANIASGNYCQPRCAEPWTEVVFEDIAEGRAQVIVSPLVRLTNKAEASIEQVGTPEGVLEAIGPFITGTYLDMEDVKAVKTEKRDDGLTYYKYEVFAPYGTNGAHSIATITTKGELALMLVLSASDKQWAKSESKLRQVLETFRA